MESKPVALVVEDNEDQSLVFSMALTRAGYETESIGDGLAAQRRLAEIVPHIVVLDLHLPGLSGQALLSQIRGDNRFKNVRVILATADATLGMSLQPQADLILLKPISFFQLSKLASRFLTQPKFRDFPGRSDSGG
jgi:CheY-like chemotaxis protein